MNSDPLIPSTLTLSRTEAPLNKHRGMATNEWNPSKRPRPLSSLLDLHAASRRFQAGLGTYHPTFET